MAKTTITEGLMTPEINNAFTILLHKLDELERTDPSIALHSYRNMLFNLGLVFATKEVERQQGE